MKFRLITILMTIALFLSTSALAADHQGLEQRVDALEKALAARPEKSSDAWYDNIVVSGAVEVEASYVDPDTGDATSDLVVATAALGIEMEPVDNVSAALFFLHEEDDTDFEVDVATFTYAFDDSGFSVTLGQDYVPFGSYETVLVNDPITLEIGETRETALIANFESGQFVGAFYVFNGDQDEVGQDELKSFGARIGFVTDLFTLGADYLSNLADSDGLQGKDYGYSAGEDVVDGASFYGTASLGPVTLAAEHLSALDQLGLDGINSEPSATQVELSIAAYDFTYGVAYQETEEAIFLGLPEERISFGVRTQITDNLGVGLEVGQDDDYSIADGGSGGSTKYGVLQFAAEF